MSLYPTITELQARARADLRMGVPVVLRLQDATAIVLSAETLTPQRWADVVGLGGAPLLAITTRRAETLKARAYSEHVARVLIPKAADQNWIRAIADPADDLRVPMKGPFHTQRDGDESLSRAAITLCKASRLLPAAVVLHLPEGGKLARDYDLTFLDAGAAYSVLHTTSPLHPVVNARLPLEVSEAGRLHIFRPEDGGEEHYAIEIGRPDRRKPVLSRLHSACFTGDVLGSLKCDCGPQLRSALAQMGHEGEGILLYLNQEGRGIGLANKMRAYSLQDQGFDTVEANHRLGFEDDERDFRIGSEILKSLGFCAVRLMTNNPKKVDRMQENGVQVTERVALKVGENPHNTNYLATKAKKSGHIL